MNNLNYELKQLERDNIIIEAQIERDKESLINDFKSVSKDQIFGGPKVEISEIEIMQEIAEEENTNEEYLTSIFKQLGVKNLPNPKI